MVISKLHGHDDIPTKGIWPFRWSAKESLHPNLWHGLAGCYAPFLGITDEIVDLSGNGNNAIIVNAPPWVETRYGNTLDYNGSNQYLSMQNPPELNFGTGDFSYGAWIQPTGNNTRFISHGGYSAGIAGYVMAIKSTSTIEVEVSGSSTRFISANGGSVTQDGVKWTFVMAVVNRETGMRCYIDGVDTFGSAGTSGESVDSSQNLNIGRKDSSADYFPGRIGPVYIYNRVLEPSEVMQLYLDHYALFRTLSLNVGENIVAAGGTKVGSLINGGLVNRGLIRGRLTL